MKRSWFGPAFVLALSPALVSAQNLTNMIANAGLSPEDFSVMSTAAQDLYVKTQPVAGANTAWENPKTKSYGTVTIETVSNGCVALLHRVHPKGADRAREIRNRRCQDASGAWLNQTN